MSEQINIRFYKEERAAVTKNYVRQVANYGNRDVFEVLENAAQECIEAAKRIDMVLIGREPYRQAWLDHLNGYLHMHLSVARYRLDEIGLAQEKSVAVPEFTTTSQETFQGSAIPPDKWTPRIVEMPLFSDGEEGW